MPLLVGISLSSGQISSLDTGNKTNGTESFTMDGGYADGKNIKDKLAQAKAHLGDAEIACTYFVMPAYCKSESRKNVLNAAKEMGFGKCGIISTDAACCIMSVTKFKIKLKESETIAIITKGESGDPFCHYWQKIGHQIKSCQKPFLANNEAKVETLRKYLKKFANLVLIDEAIDKKILNKTFHDIEYRIMEHDHYYWSSAALLKAGMIHWKTTRSINVLDYIDKNYTLKIDGTTLKEFKLPSLPFKTNITVNVRNDENQKIELFEGIYEIATVQIPKLPKANVQFSLDENGIVNLNTGPELPHRNTSAVEAKMNAMRIQQQNHRYSQQYQPNEAGMNKTRIQQQNHRYSQQYRPNEAGMNKTRMQQQNQTYKNEYARMNTMPIRQSFPDRLPFSGVSQRFRGPRFTHQRFNRPRYNEPHRYHRPINAYQRRFNEPQFAPHRFNLPRYDGVPQYVVPISPPRDVPTEEENNFMNLQLALWEEDAAIAEAEALLEEIAKFECLVCYVEYEVDDGCFQCSNWAKGNPEKSHAICRECLQGHAQAVVYNTPIVPEADGIHCVEQGCENVFILPNICKYLTFKTAEALLKRMQDENISMASHNNELEGLYHCETCKHYGWIDKSQPTFFCECGEMKCSYCFKPYENEENDHRGKTCVEVEEAETKEKTNRLLAEEMSEIVVRKCPKCNLRFVKESGCNKMTCRCGTYSCYLCNSIVQNYDHFCSCATLNGIIEKGKCSRCNKSCRLHEDANAYDEEKILNIRTNH